MVQETAYKTAKNEGPILSEDLRREQSTGLLSSTLESRYPTDSSFQWKNKKDTHRLFIAVSFKNPPILGYRDSQQLELLGLMGLVFLVTQLLNLYFNSIDEETLYGLEVSQENNLIKGGVSRVQILTYT